MPELSDEEFARKMDEDPAFRKKTIEEFVDKFYEKEEPKGLLSIVKDKIADGADRIGGWFPNIWFRGAYLSTAVILGNNLMKDLEKEPLYYASGLFTALIAGYFDDSSTKPFIELVNTEEFKESYFKDKFKETNPVLGKHPTMEEYRKRSVIVNVIRGIAGIAYPAFAYAYALSVPFVCRNNRNVVKSLEEKLARQKRSKEIAKKREENKKRIEEWQEEILERFEENRKQPSDPISKIIFDEPDESKTNLKRPYFTEEET